MAQPVLLQESYERGIYRDIARYQLPQNALWDAVDWISNLRGIPIAKRGPWRYGSDSLGGTSIRTLGYGDFEPTPALVAVNNLGAMFTVNLATGAVTSVGGSGAFYLTNPGPPIFFRDRLIWCDRNGVGPPHYWKPGMSATAALTGAQPARTGTAHLSRLVLGGVPANPDNVYFSNPGDSMNWNAENFIPTTYPVTALSSLRTSLIVFSGALAQKITGSIPPAEPNDDMALRDFLQMGTTDDRSVWRYGDYNLFSNRDGIWQTDGAAASNFVDTAGFRGLYDDLIRGYDPATWKLLGGVMRDRYFLTIRNASNAVVTTLRLNMVNRRLGRMTNFDPVLYVDTQTSTHELIFGLQDEPRLAMVGAIFHDSALTDPDGVPILPVLETPYYRVQVGPKRIRHLFLVASMTGGTSPSLVPEFVQRPEETSYRPIIANGTRHEVIYPTSPSERHRIPFYVASEGFGLRLTQVGPSLTTSLFDILADIHTREGSKSLR